MTEQLQHTATYTYIRYGCHARAWKIRSAFLPTCNETNHTRTDLIFWVCMALRNQSKLLRRLSLKYSLKLCCKIIRHPLKKNSYHRSVFIHCSQFYNNTAKYGRPLILVKTHVVLVRVACAWLQHTHTVGYIYIHKNIDNGTIIDMHVAQ